MALQISPCVFTCPQNFQSAPGKFLKMTADRYSTRESAANAEGLTLIFGHGIGSHKEQWEPIIEEIFRLQHSKVPHQRLHEAWTLDRQNHGDAVLALAAYEWAEAIAAFVLTPAMQGKRIVLIGHSAAAISMVGATKPTSISPYTALILIEPAMVAPDLFHRYVEKTISGLAAAIPARRDTWPSREYAHKWFKERYPWNIWDTRVLQAFTTHGLVDMPDGSVTLKCDKYQEPNCYPDTFAHFDSVDHMARACSTVPVHIVWGTRDDLVPEIARGSISDHSKGRLVTSITRVEGGHMLVQENPNGVALEIRRILDTINAVPEMYPHSRL
ncbi:Alpha/beta hydrolase family-domain-containing protein [Mycena latifolia]|nr:Alpha/beta hydrolase family-domain-containing protein [Mycena latifolia]